MPSDARPAVSGQQYDGVLELHLGTDGILTELSLGGDGWTVVSFDAPAVPLHARSSVLRIPFRALPSDADEPIVVSLSFNGFRMDKPIEIGPASFARRGQVLRAVAVPESELPRPVSRPVGDSVREDRGTRSRDAGGRSTLRFEGRIVYQRPDGQWVGADRLDVRVWDSDTIGHEEMWSGYTDSTGYFDTGSFSWDDSGDDPDLVVYFETETDWVDVTDSSIAEWTYCWETEEIGNFQGSYHDFGNITVASELMPALHLHSTVTRARRWVYTQSNGYYSLPQVQVEWPDDSSSSPSFYQCWGGDESEIHTTTAYQWHENVLCHEYGHHFHCSTWEDWQESDYCNDGDWCDPVPGDDCTHCAWCQENLVVAWKEGIAQYFAHRIPPTFAEDYVFDVGGAPHGPLYTESFETPQTCQEDPAHFHDARLTEGFVAALLVDMADDEQDDHDGDGVMDSTCFGDESILHVIAELDPASVLEFIDAWISAYPELTDTLWSTAVNVSPFFTPPGEDTEFPVMLSLDSPSHPLGGFGVLPCITVEWRPQFDVEDDLTGACEYSYEWTPYSGGTIPDIAPDEVDFTSCDLRISGGPFDLGEQYLSIRVRDCSGRWGPAATFGPFVIGECNNNGILDLCEIACDQSGAPLLCELDPNFCNVAACGTAADCNTNLVPDDCDIASGFSADCNLNAVPDECENMYHWAAGSSSWHTPANWLESTTPAAGAEVCIDVAGDETVTYSLGSLQVGTLACSENLVVAGTSDPCLLALANPSFIRGGMTLRNSGTSLQVIDSVAVGGRVQWNDSGELAGVGTTYMNGGVDTAGIVYLDNHRLVLDGNSTSVGTARVEFTGASTVEIRYGSSYEHQGGTYFINGGADDQLIVQGTLIKSVNTGASMIRAVVSNSGLIHVQAGTLNFYQQGSSSGGDMLGDSGTTLQFMNGGFTFHAGSSVVADNVLFGTGAGGWNTVRGTWNVTTATTISNGQDVTFAEEANIVSFGPSFHIPQGTANFNTPIGGPIQFDTLTIGPSSIRDATANFNSGDPVEITNLTIARGTLQGPSPVAISGLMTWNQGGRFYGPGTIDAVGTMLVSTNGDERFLGGCTFNNAGTATFLGGFNRQTLAVVNNLDTGVMDFQADVAVIGGSGQPFNNAGTLVKTAGTGMSTIQAATTNTGTIEVQTGVLRFYTNYGGSFVQIDGQTVLNGGGLQFDPGAMQISGGLLTGAGTITGNVVNVAGTVAPGLPIGQIDIVGAYTQYPTAALDIEIGDVLPGAYDAVVCSGNVTMTGDLHVTFVSPFEPMHGDTFVVVVSGGTLSGPFGGVSVTNLPPAMILGVDYSDDAVTLTVIGGDCDSSGVIDIDDFATLDSCTQGPDVSMEPGCECIDLDRDGDVDLRDFVGFQRVFMD
ncbi:MAG: hypothetical protein JXO22_00370 [Phycisphaerae bacterium]|nr:hypothetical protein [Phycisphaerae bacterium]